MSASEVEAMKDVSVFLKFFLLGRANANLHLILCRFPAESRKPGRGRK